MSDTETFSSEGPICPHCGRKYTADEPWFYDDRLTEMECDECGETFAVEVFTQTTWTCNRIAEIEGDSNGR